MSLPVGAIPAAVMQVAATPFDMMVSTINTNPIFIGLMMLSMNLGARFLSFELTKQQEKFLQHPYFRRFIIFVVFFIATRNVVVAFWLALIVILCIGYLFNENSALCVFKGGAEGSTCASEEGFASGGAGLTPEEQNILNMLLEKQRRGVAVDNNKKIDVAKPKSKVDKYSKNIKQIKTL